MKYPKDPRQHKWRRKAVFQRNDSFCLLNELNSSSFIYNMPRGEIVFRNGDSYEGELKSDQPNGTGIYKFKNKSYYEG